MQAKQLCTWRYSTLSRISSASQPTMISSLGEMYLFTRLVKSCAPHDHTRDVTFLILTLCHPMELNSFFRKKNSNARTVILNFFRQDLLRLQTLNDSIHNLFNLLTISSLTYSVLVKKISRKYRN